MPISKSRSLGAFLIGLGLCLPLFFEFRVLSVSNAQNAPTLDTPPPELPAVNSPPAGAPAPPPPPPPSEKSVDSPVLDVAYVYDPTGRRDPFFPSTSLIAPQILTNDSNAAREVVDESPDGGGVLSSDPLLSYNLRDYRLVGILWDVQDPKAMVLAPNKRVYTVRKQTKVGRESAVVAQIREKELVFVQPDENGDYRRGIARVMRMKN